MEAVYHLLRDPLEFFGGKRKCVTALAIEECLFTSSFGCDRVFKMELDEKLLHQI